MYIRNSHVGFLADGFNKMYLHPTTQVINTMHILNLYESGEFGKEALLVVEFIYNHIYTSENQLLTFCELNNIKEPKKLLDKLFNLCIVNRMAFANSKGEVRFDALLMYCVTDGGRALLTAYVDSLHRNFASHNTMLSSLKISECLVLADITLSFMKIYGKNLISYELLPKFSIAGERFYLDSQYMFKDSNGNIQNIVFYIVLDSDDPLQRARELKNLESVFSSNIWKTYYPGKETVPSICFVASDDDKASAFISQFINSNKITQFGITTPERLKYGVNKKGCIISYDNTTGMLVDTLWEMFS